MSRRGSEGGRKKSLLDPRRHVKCPVSECKYSGRTDHVKRHFRNLIVWSKTYEAPRIYTGKTSFLRRFESVQSEQLMLELSKQNIEVGRSYLK